MGKSLKKLNGISLNWTYSSFLYRQCPIFSTNIPVNTKSCLNMQQYDRQKKEVIAKEYTNSRKRPRTHCKFTVQSLEEIGVSFIRRKQSLEGIWIKTLLEKGSKRLPYHKHCSSVSSASLYFSTKWTDSFKNRLLQSRLWLRIKFMQLLSNKSFVSTCSQENWLRIKCSNHSLLISWSIFD